MNRLTAATAAVALWTVLQLGYLGVGLAAPPVPASPTGSQSAATQPAPLFAFYYQWFDPASWSRAKIDFPLLGRYSSDDPRVMRQHIQWAKSAGINGFIVSWKDTPTDDRRLHLLAGVAASEHFQLAMIYQGLDFSRKPLPAADVAHDFLTFRDQFAADPVFYRIGGKPLTIFSGTWAYTHAQVAAITTPVRSAMLVLSTEKTLQGYHRIADVTDGDAYYWSSVNPSTNPTYVTKLDAMSHAIHADGKYWIAPFAAGFDARLVGGTKTVPRAAGQTMRTEYSVAIRSSPDMLGLISWNEFSENTYIEPSQKYRMQFLTLLAQLRNTPAPTPPSAVDSSESPTTTGPASYWPSLLTLISLPVLLAVAVGVLGHRRRARYRHPTRSSPPNLDPEYGFSEYV